MFLPGLVSITFRKLTPAAIIDLVAETGLAAIEWGGDVHVPHGDLTRARQVGQATRAAGLAVASYGSYYRLGDNPDFTFATVLATAVELGAPLVRVWAGRRGSAAADADYRAAVAREALAAADAAGRHGLQVACEFHAGTLTDTTESAGALLAAANHPNLHAYWQPPVGWQQAQYEASLAQILPRLAALHVFQWRDDGSRLPLADGQARWAPLLNLVATRRPELACPALLEFVRDDDPQAFRQDAATLKALVTAIR